MFFEPVETPYDLHWRLFGVDIRINPWFWVMSAALGWSRLSMGTPFLVIWIVCVLVSILVHEFGHVMVGRLFGSDGHIVLYSFGGLAVGSVQVPGWWKRILVCLAGPMAGFLLWGILQIAIYFIGDAQINPVADEAIFDLLWINLFWGIFNLLPIWPLDGGQISQNLFTRMNPSRGSYYAHGLSFLCAAALAVNALAATRAHSVIPYAPTGLYAMIMFGALAAGSYSALQQDNRPW
jgi:stage IV sporulation protein FB